MLRKIRIIAMVLLILMTLQVAAFAVVPANAPSRAIDVSEDGKVIIDDKKSLEFSIMTDDGLIGPCYSYIQMYNGQIYCEGMTSSPYIADRLTLSIYLQEWRNNKWVNVENWVSHRYDFTVLIDGALTSNFTSGNYYRTKCVHGVLLGDKYDSFTTYSDSIKAP